MRSPYLPLRLIPELLLPPLVVRILLHPLRPLSLQHAESLVLFDGDVGRPAGLVAADVGLDLQTPVEELTGW